MEGDSHLDRERFMTEMGHVPPVNSMYYVALWLFRSQDIHVLGHFYELLKCNGLCTM